MTITVIGVGLIGGSLGLLAKQKKLASHVIGVDVHAAHTEKAMELGLVDEVCNLEEGVKKADLIIIAIPVSAIEAILTQVMNWVTTQVVMDTGSIKQRIINTIKDHEKRSRFVATHPMWGTEYSGPQAATTAAFANKAVIICGKEDSDEEALDVVQNLYKALQMHVIYMNAAEHDLHVAYISHVSHITSFALANTVLEKEKEEDAIFELASSGFESTVRLAKSNAAMWVPLLLQNKENVLDVLEEHIFQLLQFKQSIVNSDEQKLKGLINAANEIKRILK